MFTLLDSIPSSFQQEVTKPFLRIFNDNPALHSHFEDEKRISLIVSHLEEGPMHGGAILVKRKAAELPQITRKAMIPFASAKGDVWTCTVCLHLKDNRSFPDFEPYCKAFYQKLYESLVDFGYKNQAKFLCMILIPGEYLSTEVIGLWPYVVEVRPQESRDGLFHGVLSLVDGEMSSPTHVWQTSSPDINKLAA